KIHDKGVEIVDASCPDKVCVHTGFINKPSQSIVCIPNRVSIKAKVSLASSLILSNINIKASGFISSGILLSSI
ncbi:NusG domain II-containing protein, partial [Clostridioides difficile]